MAKKTSPRRAVDIAPAVPEPRARTARAIGPDGRTLGQRLRFAMAKRAPPMSERDLVSACADWKDDSGRQLVSQQLVNQILKDKNSRSAIAPLLAEALGVRAIWLQFGIEPMLHEAPNGRGAMSHRDRADKAFMEAFRELPKEWEFMVRSIVGTLAVAMRESHGEFAKRARAKTSELLNQYGVVHDE